MSTSNILTAPSEVRNSSSFSVSNESVVKCRSRSKNDLRGTALMSRCFVNSFLNVRIGGRWTGKL